MEHTTGIEPAFTTPFTSVRFVAGNGYVCIYGGPKENRTLTSGVQNRCAPIITMSPLIGGMRGESNPYPLSANQKYSQLYYAPKFGAGSGDRTHDTFVGNEELYR